VEGRAVIEPDIDVSEKIGGRDPGPDEIDFDDDIAAPPTRGIRRTSPEL
jgi:hypothetical protein